MMRRSKYGAVPTVVNGRTYHSKAEAEYATELRLLQRAGEIHDLREQHAVTLTRAAIRCVIDFSYIERGRRVFLECKGYETERWRIVRALWKFYGPSVLRIVKRERGGFRVVEEIQPEGVA